MAIERRSHSVKNYFRTVPPVHLSEEANYALPGCKSMLPDQGQSQGKEATFPINIYTDNFGCGSTCSSNSRCGLQAEYWNTTAVSPTMHLLLFHTQHCSEFTTRLPLNYSPFMLLSTLYIKTSERTNSGDFGNRAKNARCINVVESTTHTSAYQ